MLNVLQGSPLGCARMCRYEVYGASLESGLGAAFGVMEPSGPAKGGAGA